MGLLLKLADIESGFKLYALCLTCERMVALPFRRLREQLGPTATVMDVRRRLRCRRCGARSEELRIVYTGEREGGTVFHYR